MSRMIEQGRLKTAWLYQKGTGSMGGGNGVDRYGYRMMVDYVPADDLRAWAKWSGIEESTPGVWGIRDAAELLGRVQS